MTHYKVLILSKETTGGTGKFIEDLVSMPYPHVKFWCVFYKKHYLCSNIQSSITVSQSVYPDTLWFSFQKVLILFKNLFFTIRILRSYKPNIVIACDLYSFILFSLLKLIFQSKIIFITTIHINIREYILTKRGVYKNLLNLAIHVLKTIPDFYVAVSKGLSKQLQEHLGVPSRKITTIYNGISFSKSQGKLQIKNTVQKIITVGRLDTTQKDFDTLLSAFQQIRKKFSRITLKIVGDGKDREEVDRLIRKYGLSNNVLVTGWVKDPSKYLIQSDIFILSSFFEGFSYTLVEAMRVGLPIISTNSQFGPQEILGNSKYGLLVPVGDRKLMVQKLEMLITDKKKREYFSAFAFKRAADFSLEKMRSSYLQLFEKLLQISK